MSLPEPALKRKREDMENEMTDSTAFDVSSISQPDERKCMSPDPFSDCSMVENDKISPNGDSEIENQVDLIERLSEKEELSSSDETVVQTKAQNNVNTDHKVTQPSCSLLNKECLQGPTWKGCPLTELRKGSHVYGLPQMPPIKPSSNHTVLFQGAGDRINDLWDGNHVRMPCSPKSQYPIDGVLHSRWDLIKSALSKPITNSNELEAAIMSYNTKYKGRWDFSGLHHFINEVIEPPETECFFKVLLPQMTHLALKLPQIVPCPIPLLRQHHTHSISLSQMQIACLLANAFFCTFPRRNASKQASEYSTFPDINFNRLFQMHKKKMQQCFEKLKCLFHYFRRVCHEPPTGTVTFTRRYVMPSVLPHWDHSGHYFRKLHISIDGTIEDEGKGMLQMDFANKMIGGGVLGWGCVQEEIRFVICPELIVARLFTECLDNTEALLITGCEQFSKYKGYADSFEWDGDYQDSSPRDSSGRRMCSIVAIDALALRYPSHQFSYGNISRELNKAYVGFYNPDLPNDQLMPVATGNWGCGVYRGNSRLKALIQLLATAQTGRALAYFTFGNAQLCNDVAQMHKFLTDRRISVGTVWHQLSQYYEQCFRSGTFIIDLYDYIYQALDPTYSPTMQSKGRNKAPLAFPVTKTSPQKEQKKNEASKQSPTKGSESFISKNLNAVKKRNTIVNTASIANTANNKPCAAVMQKNSLKLISNKQVNSTSGSSSISASSSFSKQANLKSSQPPNKPSPPLPNKPLKSGAKESSSFKDSSSESNGNNTTKTSLVDWLEEYDIKMRIPQQTTIQKRIYDYFYEINIPK